MANPALPFDERNRKDYERVTASIHAALDKIRKDSSIPATQEDLARLAACTRKTLHNRVWPIDELKQIKADRKRAKEEKAPEALENSANHETLMLERVHRLEEENALMYDQILSLQEDLQAERNSRRFLMDKAEALQKDVVRLERELRNALQPRGNVVELHPGAED